MARYTSTDFGYDFADKQPENNGDEEEAKSLLKDDPLASASNTASAANPGSSAAAQANDEGGYKLYEEQKEDDNNNNQQDDSSPYRYNPPEAYRGGESYVVGSGGSDYGGSGGGTVAISGILCWGGFCCCLAVGLVIAGGVTLAYQAYKDDHQDNDADENDNNNDNAELFLAGTILIVLAVGACLCGCCSLCLGGMSDLQDGKGGDSNNASGHKEVKVRLRRLNDRLGKCRKAEQSLDHARLDVVGHIKEFKEAARKEAKDKKDEETKLKKELEERVLQDIKDGKLNTRAIQQKYRPVTFFIVFDGDVMVSTLELLRKQVSLVVNLARPGQDKCVISLTSPGGAVSQYGLAASQLVRIRKAGIHLTVCVDSVAASGGYMMASTADWICAAPFAVVGSIGVVTQIPNFQRFLNEHKIDAYLMTAGEYKRTIDVIGDVTKEGKAKLKEELDDIHIAFKDHVALARPKLREKMNEIGTGEHWLAVQAKEKGLVDQIMTSDEYLESICKEYDVIEILEKKEQKRGDLARLMGESMGSAAASIKSVADRLKTTTDVPERSPPAMAIV